MNDREKFMVVYTWLNASFPEWSPKKRIATLIGISQYLCPTIKIPEMEKTLLEITDILLEVHEINDSIRKKQESKK